jgi:Fe-S cluster biogenesis protein NfuA
MMAEKPDSPATLQDRVADVIGRIRPYIQADGGDIELVGIDQAAGKVSVRFRGACRGCPASAMTLKLGVERHLKEQVPEISEVVSVP